MTMGFEKAWERIRENVIRMRISFLKKNCGEMYIR